MCTLYTHELVNFYQMNKSTILLLNHHKIDCTIQDHLIYVEEDVGEHLDKLE